MRVGNVLMYDILLPLGGRMSRREFNPLTWSVKHVRVCQSSIQIRCYMYIEAVDRSIFM